MDRLCYAHPGKQASAFAGNRYRETPQGPWGIDVGVPIQENLSIIGDGKTDCGVPCRGRFCGK